MKTTQVFLQDGFVHAQSIYTNRVCRKGIEHKLLFADYTLCEDSKDMQPHALKLEIGRRIRTAREAKGLTLKGLAALTNSLSPSRIGNYEQGSRTPGPHEAIELAHALGNVRASYLMCLDEAPQSEETVQMLAEPSVTYLPAPGVGPETGYDPERDALIPYYDVRPCGGDGSHVEQERVVSLMAIERAWLHRSVRANPANLRLFTIRGVSMSKTLEHGDLALVDLSSTRPREGVFILNYSDDLVVKRLQVMGEAVLLKSDNPLYNPILVQGADLENLRIIGEVVWSWRGSPV